MLCFSNFHFFKERLQMLKFITIFLFLIILLSFSGFAQTWRIERIILNEDISDGLVVDLNGNGKKDLFLIAGNFIHVFFQKEKGFSENPDQTIYFNLLGEFIDVGKVYPSSTGLELLGLSKDGVKCFRIDGSNYIKCPEYLITTEVDMPTERIGPKLVNFALDINNDGLDEIFLLQGNKLNLYRWNNTGHFVSLEVEGVEKSASVALRSRLMTEILSNSCDSKRPFFLFQPLISEQNAVLFQDFDGDGRLDIASGILRLQKPDFIFNPADSPLFIRTVSPEQGKYKFFLDLNGDGHLDLVYIEPKSILTENVNIFPFAKIYIHFQKKEKVSPTPDFFFKTVLVNKHLPFVDIDGDGAIDLISVWPEITPGSKQDIIQILVEYTLNYTFRCYLFDRQRKSYAVTPDIQFRAKVKQDFSRLVIDVPFDISGDFDGNGIKDIMIRKEPESVYVYFLDAERKGYVKLVKRLFISAELSDYFIDDLNGNGKSDLIFFGGKNLWVCFSE